MTQIAVRRALISVYDKTGLDGLARALHEALIAANPERLMWGTDWPHPSIAADVMPDDGHLLDLFMDWTPDEAVRRKILVETPTRLFGN